MSRAGRLFDVVQCLRRTREPTTTAVLAAEPGVSMRTLYRDVAVLVARGVPIRGEPGVGYVLDPGCFLPPLTFGTSELDAVLLGLKWVEKRADPGMARAAVDAMAKIEAVLPRRARDIADTPGVFVGPGLPQGVETVGTELFRDAVRGCRKVHISCRDANGVRSERTVWPIGLAFMEQGQAVMAWCKLREAFRYFHLDRIAHADVGARYHERRAVLLQRCRQQIAAERHDADTRCQEGVLQDRDMRGGRMAHDPKLLQPILAGASPPTLDITFRPMFGGLFAYADGKPFASLSDVGLALKFAGGDRDAMLALPGAAPLRYEPDQPASKSYVVIPESMLSEPDELRSWVIRSVPGLPVRRTRNRA